MLRHMSAVVQEISATEAASADNTQAGQASTYARDEPGQAGAAPPKSLMNSRPLIVPEALQNNASLAAQNRAGLWLARAQKQLAN